MDWFLYDNGLRHERVNGEKLHLYSLKSKKDPFLTLCSLFLCCFQTIYFCNIQLFFRAMFLPLISTEVLTTKFDKLFKTQQDLMDFLLLFLFYFLDVLLNTLWYILSRLCSSFYMVKNLC